MGERESANPVELCPKYPLQFSKSKPQTHTLQEWLAATHNQWAQIQAKR